MTGRQLARQLMSEVSAKFGARILCTRDTDNLGCLITEVNGRMCFVEVEILIEDPMIRLATTIPIKAVSDQRLPPTTHLMFNIYEDGVVDKVYDHIQKRVEEYVCDT